MTAPAASRPARRRRSPGALVARLVLAAIAAGALLWLASLGAVVLAASRDGARPASAIIVLGAAQYDGRPSPVLRARLDHGIALWKQGLAPRLIVTGGRRAGDRTSEAATGRRYAVANGVPDSAILMESEGRTTEESLRAAAALLAELERTAEVRAGRAATVLAEGGVRRVARDGRHQSADGGEVSAAEARSAILVSDPFHMLRLGVLARRYGIVPYTSPTRTSPISASRPLNVRYMLNESLKVPFVMLARPAAEERRGGAAATPPR